MGAQALVQATLPSISPHCKHTPMIMEGKVTQCGKQLTESGEPIEPGRWGITPRQVQHLEARFRTRDDPNMCAGTGGTPPRLGFVAACIEPNFNLAVLTYNDLDPKPVKLMISRCWSEPVGTFFRDVLITTIDTPDVGMFICFLSLYQGTEKELNAQVGQNGTTMEDGSFWQVLESVKSHGGRMIVVSNQNELESGRGLYSRLWCTWEVWCAVQQVVPIFVHPFTGTETHLFGSRGTRGFTAQKGRCGREHDALKIQTAIHDTKSIDNAIRDASMLTTIAGEVSAWGLGLSSSSVAKLMLAIAEDELQPEILNLSGNELQEAEALADFLKFNASVKNLIAGPMQHQRPWHSGARRCSQCQHDVAGVVPLLQRHHRHRSPGARGCSACQHDVDVVDPREQQHHRHRNRGARGCSDSQHDVASLAPRQERNHRHRSPGARGCFACQHDVDVPGPRAKQHLTHRSQGTRGCSACQHDVDASVPRGKQHHRHRNQGTDELRQPHLRRERVMPSRQPWHTCGHAR
eukprot:NODE_273_length_1718_cov_356.992784.p1 GENE.NODE_273_length_1718_cov_356.992784~~NODE_273_length_1718_cov_356.992784.p1  ORF type:complete len:520 (-),score=71.27 NODE_273_length_1718_cov_356.992784:141-1700(-)